MEDLTGKQFGPYQIIAPLGEGGMAAVYRAYQPAVERQVALKVLPRHVANDPQFTSRFQREATILAQFQHPHILPVFDYGQAEGYAYIVMPFVQSGTLTDLLTSQPLPLARIRQVIAQIGGALGYAHTRGVIHRDVKPSNILIDEGGNCLLTDFGLARMAETSVNLTASGAIVGTPAYMSPEQGSGQKIDARSDLYSLGVILYEMATGRVPYKAETPVAVIFKHIQDALPPAQTLNPDLSDAVTLVIQKALAKRPEDRYQTAADMVRALDAAIANAAEAAPKPVPQIVKTPPPPPAVVEKPMRSRRWSWGWGLGGLAAMGLVLACGVLLVLGVALNIFNQARTSLPSLPPKTVQIPLLTNTPDALLPDWQSIGGSWTGPDDKGMVSGKTAAFDGDALYLFKNTYSDFMFSAAVQVLTREASLALRMSDDGKNGYLVIFIPQGSKGGNPGLWLAKRVNGNHTFPAFFAAEHALGERVQLTVYASGPQIRVSLNGEQVIDYQDFDQPFVSGRLGLRCYGEPSAPCEANFSEFYLSH